VEGEGSYLGELSTLLGIPRTATVKTMSHCKFIIVSGDRVSDFFDCSPVLGFKLAKILADRLAKMNEGYLKLEQRMERLGGKLIETTEKLKKGISKCGSLSTASNRSRSSSLEIFLRKSL
jgi:CRP-like cAMP-binding protein